MRREFIVLIAVLDWFSRYVVSWRLSNTLDTGFCVEALDAALDQGQPLIFNTDQGAQFTSTEWIERPKASDILISMDGRGRALDSVFVERLWRTLKHEEIYLRGDDGAAALAHGLGRYIDFYNEEEPHTAP
jgi:putative transposase